MPSYYAPDQPETPYDPEVRQDRVALASELQRMLTDAGFSQRGAKVAANEEIWMRLHHRDPRVRVVVYTTIEDGSVRAVGTDAIRVVAQFDNGISRPKPMHKNKRVFRTGTIEGIVERTYQRMRDAYGDAFQGTCRDCGAPLALSKAGKRYCAAVCWEGA
jgi:hypothetical protein